MNETPRHPRTDRLRRSRRTVVLAAAAALGAGFPDRVKTLPPGSPFRFPA